MESFIRVVLHTQDVEQLIGRSDKIARELLRNIRKYFKKKPNELVTIPEFAMFLNIDVRLVIECLNSGGSQSINYRKKK